MDRDTSGGSGEVTEQKSLPTDDQKMRAYFSWLTRALETTPFGEVGITFIVHEGKVVRIKKLLEESHRIEQS